MVHRAVSLTSLSVRSPWQRATSCSGVDADQKFKPAQLPAGGGGAVDSVNGETGVVSLGIQDMDDFSLLADDGLDVGTYDTYVNTVSNLSSTPGGTTLDIGSDTLPIGARAFFGKVGADGVDRKASFETLDNDPVWLSINGLPFVQTTGEWVDGFNGYLEVVINGTGAAPDGTVINDVRITAVEPGVPQPLEDGDYLRWNANSQQFLPAQLPDAPVDSVNGETGAVSLGIQDMDDFELNQPAGGDGTWLYRYWSSSGAPSGQFYRNGTTSYFVSYTDSDGGSRRDELLGIQVGDTISFFNINNPAEFTTGSVTDLSSNDFKARVLISTNINSGFFTDDETYAFSSPALGNARVPLANSDVLQWDATSQRFRPTQLATVATSGSYNDLTDQPTIPAEAPVDSVNGETGVVSLGIQGMNDYELQVVSGSYYGLTTEVSSYTQVENPDDYYIGASSLFSMPGDWNDSITAGDTLTIQRADQTTEFTYTIDQIITNANSKGAIRYLFIEEVDPSLNMLESEYSSGIIISSTSIGANTKPLAEGDILQWDNAEQKFKPAQLPAGGGGAVDSVNDQTGDVSLGIQDMDDFSLLPQAKISWTFTSDLTAFPAAGLATNWTGVDWALSTTDSNGDDKETLLYALDVSSRPTNVYINGVLVYSGTSSQWRNKSDDRITCRFGDDSWKTGLSDRDLLTLETPEWEDGFAPLLNDDILQWDDADQKFKPAQLATVATTGSYNDLTDAPTIPGDAPVDSVNGETGIVSLGVQDMNDFYTAPPLVETVRLVVNNFGAGQGECQRFSRSGDGNGLWFGGTEDADGVDLQDYFAAFEDGSTIWYSTNGGSTYNTTTADFFDYNGGTRNVLIADALYYAVASSNGITIYLSVADPTGEVPNKLVGGTVLVWNDFIQKFKPTQLATVTTTGSYNDLTDQPTIPGDAPVDSVNGEIGAVSLGIQDMDDFRAEKSLFFDEYRTSWTGATSGAYRIDDSDPLAIRFATRINSVPVNDEMTGLSGSDIFLAFGSTVIGPMTATITQTNTAYTLLTSTSLTSEIIAEIEAWGLGGGGIYFISSALTSSEAENFISDGDILRWDGVDQKFKPAQLPAGSGGGATSVFDLTDVSSSSSTTVVRYATVSVSGTQGASNDPGELAIVSSTYVKINNRDSDGRNVRAMAEGIIGAVTGDAPNTDVYISRDGGNSYTAHTGNVRILSNETSTVRIESLSPAIAETTAEVRLSIGSISSGSPVNGDLLVWSEVEQTFTLGNATLKLSELSDVTTADSATASVYSFDPLPGYTGGRVISQPNANSAYLYAGLSAWDSGAVTLVGGASSTARSSITLTDEEVVYFHPDPGNDGASPTNYTIKVNCDGTSGQTVVYRTAPTLGTGNGDLVIPTMGQVRTHTDGYISLATLKAEVAASTDFADFQARIAAL